MKKLYPYLLFLALFTSCKTFDPKLLNPTGAPFSNKLPSLEPYVENTIVTIVDRNGNIIGASPVDVKTLFERDVQELMTNPYGDKKGTIVLKITNIETRSTGMGYLMIHSLFPVGVIMGVTMSAVANIDNPNAGYYLFALPLVVLPMAVGIPIHGAKSAVEVEIEIKDNNGKLIGKYRGTGMNKFNCTLYKNNYFGGDALRVCYLEATRAAISDAKNKMVNDLGRLNAELSK